MGGRAVTTESQVNFYAQHTETDPTRRSYSIGDQAAVEVVRLAASAGTVAVDIETAGLGAKAFQVKVVIIATPARSCVLDASNPAHRAAASDALAVANTLVFHNSAFDVPPLVTAGIMGLEDIEKVVDTLVYARMALTGVRDSRKLGDLEKRYLSGALRTQTKDNLAEWGKVNRLSKAKIFEQAQYSDPIYAMYAGWDGILTSMIVPHVKDHCRRQLTEHPFGRYGADAVEAEYLMEREQRVNRVMLKRSARGLRIDDDAIAAEEERIRVRMGELAEELTTYGVEDPSNRNQLAASLEAAEAFPEDYPRTAKTNRPSTQGKHLEVIDHPMVRAFTGYDDIRRLFTYLENARLVAERTDGKIHPSVNILHARTGRMSYGSPALQQFTGDARHAILADEGREMTSLDWSQIEPVLGANLAGDVDPIKKYEAGGDLYQVAADAAGVTRKTAKVVLLAMLYGQGIKSLAAGVGVEVAEAKVIRAKVAAAMPLTDRFTGWAAEWSGTVGKTWTLSGRIIDVDPEFGYKGTNFTVQGSSYDVLAESVIGCQDAGLEDAILIAVHDELVVDTEAAADIEAIMRKPPPRLVELAGRTPIFRCDRDDLGHAWRGEEK
jgi:DNA polymerase-1